MNFLDSCNPELQDLQRPEIDDPGIWLRRLDSGPRQNLGTCFQLELVIALQLQCNFNLALGSCLTSRLCSPLTCRGVGDETCPDDSSKQTETRSRCQFTGPMHLTKCKITCLKPSFSAPRHSGLSLQSAPDPIMESHLDPTILQSPSRVSAFCTSLIHELVPSQCLSQHPGGNSFLPSKCTSVLHPLLS